MTFLDSIVVKRDGGVNSREQLDELARGAADGSVPDYQLSAWLMAAYVKGLDPKETADLTLAMAHSGERLDLTGLPRPWLDKHSTGGVGDKTTLVVLPILAACGVTVVKMSGRGLGTTGGTIDKLESVPGFRTDLMPEEMVAQAKRIGIALSGQTPRLAPADKALYALRDVTGTVASIPLITASILSKKIAGGAETVVLDVKCGSGAFMKSLTEAESLAHSLVETGRLCGLQMRAVITDMDQPLGSTVGNALEVKEALAVLDPSYSSTLDDTEEDDTDGRRRFFNLCVGLAGHALEAVGKGNHEDALAAVRSGRALTKLKVWFEAQGCSIDLDQDVNWQEPRTKRDVVLDGESGYVSRVCAKTVGEVALELGAGRVTKDDPIDPTAGVTVMRGIGSKILPGEPLFEMQSSRDVDWGQLSTRLRQAVSVSSEQVGGVRPLIKIVD